MGRPAKALVCRFRISHLTVAHMRLVRLLSRAYDTELTRHLRGSKLINTAFPGYRRTIQIIQLDMMRNFIFLEDTHELCLESHQARSRQPHLAHPMAYITALHRRAMLKEGLRQKRWKRHILLSWLIYDRPRIPSGWCQHRMLLGPTLLLLLLHQCRVDMSHRHIRQSSTRCRRSAPRVLLRRRRRRRLPLFNPVWIPGLGIMRRRHNRQVRIVLLGRLDMYLHLPTRILHLECWGETRTGICNGIRLWINWGCSRVILMHRTPLLS